MHLVGFIIGIYNDARSPEHADCLLEGIPQWTGREWRCDRMYFRQHVVCVLTSIFSLQYGDQIILLQRNWRWTGQTELLANKEE